MILPAKVQKMVILSRNSYTNLTHIQSNCHFTANSEIYAGNTGGFS